MSSSRGVKVLVSVLKYRHSSQSVMTLNRQRGVRERTVKRERDGGGREEYRERKDGKVRERREREMRRRKERERGASSLVSSLSHFQRPTVYRCTALLSITYGLIGKR